MTEAFRGAIVSVGGSAEPIAKTLDEGKPYFVLFFASEESKSEIEAKIRPLLGYTPQYNLCVTPDAGDLAACYEAIRNQIRPWLRERSLKPNEVYVDITGGTKPMSAALTLAAVEWFSHFAYVSGRERTKQGLGVVVTGTEEVLRTLNPWDQLAVRERERASWFYGQRQPRVAAAILREAAKKCGREVQQEIETLACLMDLFADADRFDFSRVSHTWSRIRDRLRLVFRGRFQTFEEIEGLVELWKKVQDERRPEGLHPSTLRELLANAGRRAQRSKFDDAIARLYRAAELFVQDRIFEAFECCSGKVPLDRLPEHARSNFRADEHEVVRCGVRTGFEVLAFSSNAKHVELSKGWTALQAHLNKRNESILAHGLRPADEEEFRRFWEELLPFLGITEEEVPRWPDMEL